MRNVQRLFWSIVLGVNLIGCSQNANPEVAVPTEAAGSTQASATPTASDQSLVVAEDGTKSIALASAEENHSATYEITSAPSHGTLVGTAPNLTYVPAQHFWGADELQFAVRVNGSVATGKITLDVRPRTVSPLCQGTTASLPALTAGPLPAFDMDDFVNLIPDTARRMKSGYIRFDAEQIVLSLRQLFRRANETTGTGFADIPERLASFLLGCQKHDGNGFVAATSFITPANASGVIWVDGDVTIPYPNGAIVIASGNVDFSHAYGSIAIARGKVDVAFDNDDNSFYLSRRLVEISYAGKSTYYSLGEKQISWLQNSNELPDGIVTGGHYEYAKTSYPTASPLSLQGEIHVVGVYEGQGGAVEVTIAPTAEPIVVALTSNEAVDWRIRLLPGAKISGVVMSGYYHPLSDVIGLPAGTPFIESDTLGYAYDESGFPSYLSRLASLLGRAQSSYRGSYSSRSVQIP